MEAGMSEQTVPATGGRTEAEVRDVVRGIVVELSPERDDAATPDTPLVEGLGYNSLALVELAFTLEDEFDLTPIDEQTARAITTLGDVVDHVVGELSGRGELVPA
jgi:acyl carrier protein